MSETRVVHIRKEPFDIYIGRYTREYGHSDWGNPFIIGRDGTRTEVIQKYINWLGNQPELLKRIPELYGKILGCYCAPEKCHGDVLKVLAEAAHAKLRIIEIDR